MRPSVCSPNARFAAIPVSVCQNWRSVSFCFGFLAKNLYLSSVLFLGFTNACSQLFFRSVSVIAATYICL